MGELTRTYNLSRAEVERLRTLLEIDMQEASAIGGEFAVPASDRELLRKLGGTPMVVIHLAPVYGKIPIRFDPSVEPGTYRIEHADYPVVVVEGPDGRFDHRGFE
jgi:hypothetical protein